MAAKKKAVLPQMPNTEAAFLAGHAAGATNDNEARNPFPILSAHASAWQNGFDKGKAGEPVPKTIKAH